jgi:phage baseplate assembly protein W
MAKIARNPDYSDLDLDFIAHPATGDLMKKTGNDAIKRSIRNIIYTNYYDRPFRPNIGGDVTSKLFENMTNITKNILEQTIERVLKALEPRVKLDRVTANIDEDNNGFNVEIYYTIISTDEKKGIGMFLERIR